MEYRDIEIEWMKDILREKEEEIRKLKERVKQLEERLDNKEKVNKQLREEIQQWLNAVWNK